MGRGWHGAIGGDFIALKRRQIRGDLFQVHFVRLLILVLLVHVFYDLL